MNSVYINSKIQDHMFAKIDTWCETLEKKAKTQTYGPQVIFFWFSRGKQYYKVIKSEHDTHADSVHAFVNISNGDIYKPASWNSPYKDARYNIWTNFDKLLNDCEWSGKYLYKK